MSRHFWLLVLMMVVAPACSGSPTDRCRVGGVEPLLGQLAALDFELDEVPPLSEATSASAASPEAFAGHDLRCEVLFFNFNNRDDITGLSISSFLTFDAAEASMEHFQERFDLRLDPETEVWVGGSLSSISVRGQEQCLTVTVSGPDEGALVEAVLAVRDALSVQCADPS